MTTGNAIRVRDGDAAELGRYLVKRTETLSGAPFPIAFGEEIVRGLTPKIKGAAGDMSDERHSERQLSAEAAALLKELQNGATLFGSFGDYGRDFMLATASAEPRTTVKAQYALELRTHALIQESGTREDGLKVYVIVR